MESNNHEKSGNTPVNGANVPDPENRPRFKTPVQSKGVKGERRTPEEMKQVKIGRRISDRPAHVQEYIAASGYIGPLRRAKDKAPPSADPEVGKPEANPETATRKERRRLERWHKVRHQGEDGTRTSRERQVQPPKRLEIPEEHPIELADRFIPKFARVAFRKTESAFWAGAALAKREWRKTIEFLRKLRQRR